MAKLLTLILAILVMVGCAESKKSRGQATVRTARTTNPGDPTAPAAAIQGMGCQGDAWGLIYSTGDEATWTRNVQLLASAAVDVAEVGYVSPSPTATDTGISFCGRVCQNSGASEVYIGIWDSNFPTYNSEISINIRNGGPNSGRLVSQQRNSSAVFQDSYGSVSFNNGMSTQNGKVTGQFCFANTQRVENGQVIQGNFSGCLGSFEIRGDLFWRTNC